MNELVSSNSKGENITTSLIVAQVFGKEHNKVCRDIENLTCSKEFNAANFGVIYYQDSMNRNQPAYEMTKDGFIFLVMGYTGEKASEFKEDFIKAFNKYEGLLKNDDFILAKAFTIANARLNDKDKLIALQEMKIKEDEPKVAFADTVSKTGTSILIRDLSRLLSQNGIDVGQNRLFEWLRNNHYLCIQGGRKGKNWNRPTQMAMDLGLFECPPRAVSSPDRASMEVFTTYVTGKGQIYFINKFTSENTFPKRAA